MKPETVETFTMFRINGQWDYAANKDTPKLYRQERDADGKVSIRVTRVYTRDRNGKKLERVSQCITGDYDACTDYVDTFPPAPSVRVSSCVNRRGIRVDTEF